MADSILTAMILVPAVGALATLFLYGLRSPKMVHVAMGFCFLTVLIPSVAGLWITSQLSLSGSQEQFAETFEWIGAYAIHYAVALDGLSAGLLVLVSILVPVLFVYEWRRTKKLTGIHGLLLVLQSALIGLICARDLFLIFFFWGTAALPFYFLTAIWGEKERERAAFQYLLTSAVSAAFLFVSMVVIYYLSEPHTFLLKDLSELSMKDHQISVGNVSISLLAVAYLCMTLGVALRVPVWPIHGWFPNMASQAPASVLVAFCGLFVPVTLVVFFRLSYVLFAEAVTEYSNVLMVIGAVNVVMGALLAVGQRELRSFTAYVCMCHVGLVLMGAGSRDVAGVAGAVYQAITVGFALAGLGLFTGTLQDRTGQSIFVREDGSAVFGGLMGRAPFFGLFAAVIFASLLGFPGLGGFIGQSLILMGSAYAYPLAVLFVVAGVIVLTYGLFTLFRVIFWGPNVEKNQALTDLTWLEKSYFLPIFGGTLFLGIYPKAFLDLIRPTVEALLAAIS